MNDIARWYFLLRFPHFWDDAVLEAAKPFDPQGKNVDPMGNLLALLADCPRLHLAYREKGIPEAVFWDTVADIRQWALNCRRETGVFGLVETDWLRRHMEMRLFRLGALQFCMAPAHAEDPKGRFAQGDPILEVHIPQSADLSPDAVRASFLEAEAFFSRHFPEYSYRYFTCHSWMLGAALQGLLKPDSGILRFAALFDTVQQEPSDSALRYVFALYDGPETSLQKNIRSYLAAGKRLQDGFGVLEKGAFRP